MLRPHQLNRRHVENEHKHNGRITETIILMQTGHQHKLMEIKFTDGWGQARAEPDMQISRRQVQIVELQDLPESTDSG